MEELYDPTTMMVDSVSYYESNKPSHYDDDSSDSSDNEIKVSDIFLCALCKKVFISNCGIGLIWRYTKRDYEDRDVPLCRDYGFGDYSLCNHFKKYLKEPSDKCQSCGIIFSAARTKCLEIHNDVAMYDYVCEICIPKVIVKRKKKNKRKV